MVQRSTRTCRDDVDDETVLVVRDHVDHEQIGDLRQREKRGIEEGDEEQPGRSERQREHAELVDESTHTIAA